MGVTMVGVGVLEEKLASMRPSDDKGTLLVDMHTGQVLRSAMADSVIRNISACQSLYGTKGLWYLVRDVGMILRAPDTVGLVLRKITGR